MGEIHLDYESMVKDIMTYAPDIQAVAIIEGIDEILYSTDNWDISTDVKQVCSSWATIKVPFIMVSGIKYTVLECEIDSLVGTSLRGDGHIIGVKDEKIHILSYVTPDGDRKSAIVELSRILAQINPKDPYIDPNADFNTSQEESRLSNEVKEFLEWVKDPEGLEAHINYYIQLNETQMIREISEIYKKLFEICQS